MKPTGKTIIVTSFPKIFGIMITLHSYATRCTKDTVETSKFPIKLLIKLNSLAKQSVEDLGLQCLDICCHDHGPQGAVAYALVKRSA